MADGAALGKRGPDRGTKAPRYSLDLEPWTDALWAELKPLAEQHFEEVDGGIEPNRPFRLDQRLMLDLERFGAMRAFVARECGTAIGYFTWNVTLDVESEGLKIAQQGAWFVAPNHPKAAFELFDFAKNYLRLEGVQLLFPHHRTQGRGANIGRFFMRQGAKDIQRTYCLWIG